jgi:SAM-dependent methyltransferase
MDRAGLYARPAMAGVRWEPSLLLEAPASQVDAWKRSLRGFARRLPVRARAEFVAGLDAPLYELQGQTAVEAEGLHPKHRLMRYHDFFVDRVARDERVIDLGCGVGALAASLAERAGARVVGMDWSPDNLEKARARAAQKSLGERLTFIQGDITVDRAGGSFDVVVLSNVLEHLKDRPGLLRRWREWYGAERFLVRVPAFDREWRVPWKQELGVEWRLDPTHETEYTRDRLEAELAEAGLGVTDCVTRWGEYWVAANAQRGKAEP